VVVANHASNLDPVILAIALDTPLCFMAKAEMFKVPGLGALIKALGAFPVVRGGGGRPAIEAAVSQAKEGALIAMFPEGTRTRNGSLGSMKPGAAIIAIEAGVPIIPVGLVGTFEAMPRGRFFPHFGRPIKAVVGRPLDTTPYQGDPEGVSKLMEAMHGAIGALVALPQAESHPLG
jgi:1-acyl-sn-glycerol-3-phosphate acyltransferase